jgi:hypothetical protein
MSIIVQANKRQITTRRQIMGTIPTAIRPKIPMPIIPMEIHPMETIQMATGIITIPTIPPLPHKMEEIPM